MTTPDVRDPDYRLFAALNNDIASAQTEVFLRLDVREAIAEALWESGWRREFRDSDYTDRPP